MLRTVRSAAVACLGLAMALMPTVAGAVALPAGVLVSQTSILDYEGYATTGGGGQNYGSNLSFDELSGTTPGTDCANWKNTSGVSQTTCIHEFNQTLLGVPIEIVGKQNTPGDFTAADPKFVGTTVQALGLNTWDGLGEGYLFTVDFSGADLNALWQIVKLDLKIASLPDLFFVTTNLFTPTQELQAAFIPKADYDAAFADGCAHKQANDKGKGECGTGLSHLNIWGTPTEGQVAEPGTLVLLGLGVSALGLVVRRRIGR